MAEIMTLDGMPEWVMATEWDMEVTVLSLMVTCLLGLLTMPMGFGPLGCMDMDTEDGDGEVLTIIIIT